MTIIFAAVVSVLIFMGIMFLSVKFDRKTTVNDRIRKLVDEEKESNADEEALDNLTVDETLSPLAATLQAILSVIDVNVEKFKENNQLRLHQAGMISPNAPVYYLFCKYVLSYLLLGLAAWVILLPASGLTRLSHFIVGLILGLGGLRGPDIYIRNCTEKRQKVLQRSFPDMLDLLLVCVESGLALDGAIARVCRELGKVHPEITKELNRTRIELTLLNDRSQALQNLADRTGLMPFRSLVGALMQSEKFGTNLTETLRVLAEDYRNERLMAAEDKAGRLPALITIPIICFMLPALIIITIGPAIIGLMAIFAKK